jgi:hypothetical protein
MNHSNAPPNIAKLNGPPPPAPLVRSTSQTVRDVLRPFVGQKIEVYWQGECMWYSGVISSLKYAPQRAVVGSSSSFSSTTSSSAADKVNFESLLPESILVSYDHDDDVEWMSYDELKRGLEVEGNIRLGVLSEKYGGPRSNGKTSPISSESNSNNKNVAADVKKTTKSMPPAITSTEKSTAAVSGNKRKAPTRSSGASSKAVIKKNEKERDRDDEEDDFDDDEDAQIHPMTNSKMERRERNKEHAKRSRERKKFLLESLQDEIVALREVIKKEMPEKAEKILSAIHTAMQPAPEPPFPEK